MELGKFAQELGQKLITEHGFAADKDDPNGLYKEIHDYFFLTFYYDPNEKAGLFGFWHAEKIQFSINQKFKLKGLLEREEFAYYLEDELEDWGGEWLVKKIKKDILSEEDIVKTIAYRYELMEMEVNAITI
jgi:hypothetical protein